MSTRTSQGSGHVPRGKRVDAVTCRCWSAAASRMLRYMTSSIARGLCGVKHIGDSARGVVSEFNEVVPRRTGSRAGAASGTASARGNPLFHVRDAPAARLRRTPELLSIRPVRRSRPLSRPRSTQSQSPAACFLYRTPFTTGVRHDGTGSAPVAACTPARAGVKRSKIGMHVHELARPMRRTRRRKRTDESER